MSMYDDSGYGLDDPKHPDNASAGAGATGLWRAKRADPVVYVCENPEADWIAGLGERTPSAPDGETDA